MNIPKSYSGARSSSLTWKRLVSAGKTTGFVQEKTTI
jgi:hypothetical protein